ncbi:MAG: HD domain-containing protein [Bacteroidia bacterium]|nr:HD domain-containing protein [Bacteroidia bacterium]
MTTEKYKIINDPVYGFINMPLGKNHLLVKHPWFQRLRHIRQLGLAFLVYPGAIHTRFQHALGAHYLTTLAVDVIRSTGTEITNEESSSICAAILLHDIGHGPFSHALEHTFLYNIRHEVISELFMESLNKELGGHLDLTLKIFKNNYHKKFLHQLVSSQLDMDRLDYLKRDSFFTGVSEGVIGSDRIIKMLNVVNDNLVVDEKGIYSIEKFLIARRLMYWQVYFHKTVLAAEQMLVNIMQKARELILQKVNLQMTTTMFKFLSNNYTENDFRNNPNLLNDFSKLDDNDLLSSIKLWAECDNKAFSLLCNRFINRQLLKIEIQNEPFSKEKIDEYIAKTSKIFGITGDEAKSFVFTNSATNNAYNANDDRINILYKSGDIKDITIASDMLNLQILSKNVVKYFFCYPEECRK